MCLSTIINYSNFANLDSRKVSQQSQEKYSGLDGEGKHSKTQTTPADMIGAVNILRET